MVSRLFTRPQTRTFSIWLAGAYVHRSVKPYKINQNRSLPQPNAAWDFPASNSVRSFISTGIPRIPAPETSATPWNTDTVHAKELQKVANITKSDGLPDEEAVQYALQICENLAKNLAEPLARSPSPLRAEKGPTTSLLSLEQEPGGPSDIVPSKASLPVSVKANISDRISMTAYNIMIDPKVFITPALLNTYVKIQAILHRPQSFPQIFDLYASKAIPQLKTDPIKYKSSNPDRLSSAVPFTIISDALNAAVESKNLALCLSIIDTTVCTTAYRRNRMIRKALLPATGLALAPVAAYALASELAQLQQSMDTLTATGSFFAGIIAYVGFTAIIGIVAISTANDQMDRITWARGTSLSARWLREDERALVDRVAGAWGFQEESMRGQEEGRDWEALREWSRCRKMVLDNPELMEGME